MDLSENMTLELNRLLREKYNNLNMDDYRNVKSNFDDEIVKLLSFMCDFRTAVLLVKDYEKHQEETTLALLDLYLKIAKYRKDNVI